MPPGNYESITVREDVLERLEQYSTEQQSYGAAIAALLDENGARNADEIAQRLTALEDEVAHVPERTADKVEQRMRR
jgi:predicted CopG family antitoxin